MLRTDICRWPGRAGTAWYAACRVLCGGLWDTVYREIDSARYRKEAYDRRAVDHVLPPIINLILTHTKVIRPGYGQNFNRLIRLSSTARTNERITPNLLYVMLWPRPRATPMMNGTRTMQDQIGLYVRLIKCLQISFTSFVRKVDALADDNKQWSEPQRAMYFINMHDGAAFGSVQVRREAGAGGGQRTPLCVFLTAARSHSNVCFVVIVSKFIFIVY